MTRKQACSYCHKFDEGSATLKDGVEHTTMYASFSSKRAALSYADHHEVYPMGLITPNDFQSLQALYTTQLRYLLSTETQIVNGLSDMIEHADDPQLKPSFRP
jgi:hypothetical protein